MLAPKRLPNPRMKLAWPGGRLKRKGICLDSGAAPRSLYAIRSAPRLWTTPSMRLYSLALAAILPLALTTLCHAQQPVRETPEQVAQRYTQAIRRGDYLTAASLMDPQALHEIRTSLAEVPDGVSGDVWQRFLGVRSKGELFAISDTALYALFIRTRLERDSTLISAFRTSRITVLGHILEGRDTAHVLYRSTIVLSGVPLSTVNVVSLSRTRTGWRCVLQADMSAFMSAMVQALRRRS